MRHKKKKNKLNRSVSHTKSTFRSIANAVIEHERITTTLPKARKAKPMVEKLISLGKKGDLHSRQMAAKLVQDKKLLRSLFHRIGPRFKNRPGGYTRIIRIGNRIGDNAPLAILELVEKEKIPKKKVTKLSKKIPPEKIEERKERRSKKIKKEKKSFVGGLRDLFKKKK